MQTLQPNSTLQGGKYIIKKVLGQGGFGITYLAEQTILSRYVAIKEFFFKECCAREAGTSYVTLGTQSNRETVQRFMSKFLKEARTISQLDHPNIIKIHDVFEENNTAYFVMDYIEGENLSEMVKHQGALPEATAVEYITKVSDALAYIHARNINHLDVKPGNIMINSRDSRIVLIDFGLSKQYDQTGSQTSSTPIGISQGYAPIEQYRAGGVAQFTPQTDIYSLGATLYWLIVGETPPAADEVLSDGISLPRSISPNVRAAIEEAMKPNKNARPKSVQAFINILTNSVSTHPSSTSDEETRIITFYEEDSKGILISLNNLKFRMVQVHGGTMTMEDSESSGFFGIFSSSRRKQVNLSDFYIGEVPITQEIWKYVMEKNPSTNMGDKKPVDSVSWNDCQEFIFNLNKITKLKFSLPTEAQWEFAARGGNSSRNLKYAGNDNADYVAWYWKNSNHQSQEVAKKLPNELGLYDMSGNVSEWCNDFFDNYNNVFEKDPCGPHNGSEHVIRGGSWSTDEKKCRVSVRDHKLPTCRDNSIGLRLVLNKN